MRTCPNCGSQITCGCQDRTASDGKKVCSNCVALYEQQIKPQNQTPNENLSTQQG
jgi:transcription initiation factor TFIIIB Brf1 subunit/transcription initiation factor TFIIB